MKRLIFVCAALLTATGPTIGCNHTTPPAKSNRTVRKGSIESIISLWEEGDHQGAVTQFVLLASNEMTASDFPAIITSPEPDYSTLSSSQREDINGEVIRLSKVLKFVARACVREAKVLAEQGNEKKSLEYMNAVQSFGESLLVHSQPNVFKALAKGIISIAKSNQ